MDMWPSAYALKDDVKSWTLQEVQAWWRTKGPNAMDYYNQTERLMIDGEKLLSLKRKDFELMGMNSWLTQMFVDWIRDLKYDSRDPLTQEELTTLVRKHTRLSTELAKLVSKFVRDNPEDWDQKELAKYLKRRGLKKTAKQIRKKKISPQNIEILIHDPSLPEKGRAELSQLYPNRTFYSMKHPHPLSWHAIIRGNVYWWLIFAIAFCTIAVVIIVRGGGDSIPLTIIGCLLIIALLGTIIGCFTRSFFWNESAFGCMYLG